MVRSVEGSREGLPSAGGGAGLHAVTRARTGENPGMCIQWPARGCPARLCVCVCVEHEAPLSQVTLDPGPQRLGQHRHLRFCQ